MLHGLKLPPTVHHHAHHRVWQRGAYDMNIWSEKKRLEKLNYMHNNPVRRRLVAQPVDRVRLWYDGVIMMSRTQIALEAETQRRARQRANDLGVSLAEYLQRLVVRDLASPQAPLDVACIFDLGSSGGSDIARDKDSMIARAFHSTRKKSRRR